MGLNHAGYLFERFEFEAHDGVVPLLEEALSARAVGLNQKLRKHLLEGPGFGSR